MGIFQWREKATPLWLHHSLLDRPLLSFKACQVHGPWKTKMRRLLVLFAPG